MRLNDNAGLEPAKQGGLSHASIAVMALALLLPFLLYFPTARSIVNVWNSSETFAHGYIIVPISLWLIWRRRENFKLFPPTPWWPALLPLMALGAAWLLARMGEVQVVQQYAFVAMLPVIALGLFGRRLATSLAFPLAFLLLAVPFGEIFIGPLIEFTADFTIWAVQATGIPVLRNGTRFELPTGNWSVVEACSGVRYLISSVTIGCLYAYLTYRSTLRRVVFVLFSIVTPIIANGLRAYMIVMIGHTSNMELATGVDHLVYGWLFFGIVMFVMFWIGSYWRQDTEQETVHPRPAVLPPQTAPGALRNVALALLAACAVWPLLAIGIDRATYNPRPVELSAMTLGGQPAAPFSTWAPDYMKPDARLDRVLLQPGQSQPVALSVLYYRNQRNDKALISSVNRIAHEDNPFHERDATTRIEQVGARAVQLRESRLDGPGGRQLVWHWMWVGGRPVTNAYVGKLFQAKSKLLFQGDDGAAIMLRAPFGEEPDEARAALRAYLQANLAPIESALETARRQ